ncbi:cysteine protease [Mycobacterium phage Indlovu]|nr:cysteine protease [Mycobacterium phage Indlovu]
MTVVERATGRLVNHDPQSRAYAAPRRALRPVSWLHTMGPVLDQGMVNGCTGWSGANWLNASRSLTARKRWNLAHSASLAAARRYVGNDAGEELYRAATRVDPFKWVYPPTDNGSSGLGVGKALKAAGAIESYLWTFSFDQLLAHGQIQVVLLGLLWTDAMSDPDAQGFIHIGTDRQVKAAVDSGMGHEVTLRGVNWPRKYATIRNQWTEDWGIKGEARIPLAELERLVIDYQGDCMVPQIGAAA